MQKQFYNRDTCVDFICEDIVTVLRKLAHKGNMSGVTSE